MNLFWTQMNTDSTDLKENLCSSVKSVSNYAPVLEAVYYPHLFEPPHTAVVRGEIRHIQGIRSQKAAENGLVGNRQVLEGVYYGGCDGWTH